MLWGCLVIFISVFCFVSVSSTSSLSFIWFVWVSKGFLLSCSLLGDWNEWNKIIGSGSWIGLSLLERSVLCLLFMQFDDHGNDLELLSEELVSMWSVGVGLEFATEWTFLVGWTRGLWLVSLNQLQFVSLERLRSFNMGKYGSVALYVSGVYTDLFLFYVKNMYYIVAFAIMVFLGSNLQDKVELKIIYILEEGQDYIIIFILKVFTMTVIFGRLVAYCFFLGGWDFRVSSNSNSLALGSIIYIVK